MANPLGLQQPTHQQKRGKEGEKGENESAFRDGKEKSASNSYEDCDSCNDIIENFSRILL